MGEVTVAERDGAVNPGAAMFAVDAASRNLGLELVDIEPGRAVVRVTVTAEMLNGHGVAHGGVVFTVADTAFACACNTHGLRSVAAGADVVFVSAAREGDVLIAEASERVLSGRSGVYDVTVWRGTPGSGDVVAEFRGRSRTIGRAEPP